MSTASIIRVGAALAGMVVFAMLAQVGFASLQSAKGNLTGTVHTPDGKPAAKLLIKLVKDTPVDIRRPGGKSVGVNGSGAVALQRERSKTVAQATTDAQGKFTFNNIEAGSYRLEAGNQNIGWIWQDVTIEADKTIDLPDLKLTKTE